MRQAIGRRASGRKVWLAGSCLVCIALTWMYGGPGLEGSEFSGGYITGHILNLSNVGLVLMIAALVLSFFYERLAGFIAVAGSLFCLPFYIYFVAPGLFRDLFNGEYSVPLTSRFVWDNSSIAAILLLLMTLVIGIRAAIRSQS